MKVSELIEWLQQCSEDSTVCLIPQEESELGHNDLCRLQVSGTKVPYPRYLSESDF